MVYIDYSTLNILAGPRSPGEAERDGRVLDALWEQFEEGDISLVTGPEDTKLDLILWLNSEGCCITDTLVVTETIDDFEKMGYVDEDRAAGFRRAFDYYDRLDGLPGRGTLSGDEERVMLSAILTALFGPSPYRDPYGGGPSPEELVMLRECLQGLDAWYRDPDWRDMRKTHYNLNWKALSPVLTAHGREPTLSGAEGVRIRRLFGFLNRMVGLSKKSWARLPMSPGHIDFVVTTVLSKYGYHEEDRIARHILNCLAHDIPYLLTGNDRMITGFEGGQARLLGHPAFSGKRLQVIRPSGLAEAREKDRRDP